MADEIADPARHEMIEHARQRRRQIFVGRHGIENDRRRTSRKAGSRTASSEPGSVIEMTATCGLPVSDSACSRDV
ncbi:MAG: hypothetical protein HT580_03220 [Dechloromonas sp.]|nr:MAG: hypothetical protein HT580_03220 [Dechloromonas sp.]